VGDDEVLGEIGNEGDVGHVGHGQGAEEAEPGQGLVRLHLHPALRVQAVAHGLGVLAADGQVHGFRAQQGPGLIVNLDAGRG